MTAEKRGLIIKMTDARSTKDLRIFSLILSLILTLVSAKFSKAGNGAAGGALLISAITACAIGLIRPTLITPAHIVLSRIGKIVGPIISAILFGIIFYCAFTPIGVILKILNKDILGLRIEKGRGSYWAERKEKSPPPESMERQY